MQQVCPGPATCKQSIPQPSSGRLDHTSPAALSFSNHLSRISLLELSRGTQNHAQIWSGNTLQRQDGAVIGIAFVAGELAESIAAGHRQGIQLEAFPAPRALAGTVGVELENGHLFFHADELGAFWGSQDHGAESETDSILAADEEGLGHLNVQVMEPCCTMCVNIVATVLP